MRDLKELVNEISKQFRGIIREIDPSGFVIGSEVLVKDLAAAYPQEKITETIFLRLKMGLKELKDMYPDLDITVASEISEQDNIYRIEMNRSERVERAFAKLTYCMRPGEVILESPNNWTVKRIKNLQDKLGMTSVY
jgi:hypothetical protein